MASPVFCSSRISRRATAPDEARRPPLEVGRPPRGLELAAGGRDRRFWFLDLAMFDELMSLSVFVHQTNPSNQIKPSPSQITPSVKPIHRRCGVRKPSVDEPSERRPTATSRGTIRSCFWVPSRIADPPSNVKHLILRAPRSARVVLDSVSLRWTPCLKWRKIASWSTRVQPVAASGSGLMMI